MQMITSKLRSLWYRSAQRLFLKESAHPKDYFGTIYSRNLWGGRNSKSGLGSEGAFARQKIELLEELRRTYAIRSILDLGCGDFNWMKDFVGRLDRYHGVDIVPDLIAANQARYGSERVSFQCIDLSNRSEQPKIAISRPDLVICFDVFGHLLNNEVDALLDFILNGLQAKYFLVTNRRVAGSTEYLQRAKTRLEGIDLEVHPLFKRRAPRRVRQSPGVYPDDFFDLYALNAGGSGEPAGGKS